jgi:sugar phosphate isomerase/epimerase
MSTLSFISANYVARETGYHMTEGWMQGDEAANAYFQPLATFPDRFAALLEGIRALGFDGIDLWTAHLNFAWATAAHIRVAQQVVQSRGLKVCSFAGYFGGTADELHQAASLAKAMGCDLLSGGQGLLKDDRSRLVSVLRAEQVRLAVENHPEKSAAELLQRMGSGDEDVIGAAVDTGWFGTQGTEASQAIHELRGRIFHLHLKDVKARRAQPTGFPMIDQGHETCRFGEGIVPLEASVRTAVRDGFDGPISLEHEPEDRDPTEDLRESLKQVQAWLKTEKNK